MLAIDEGYWFIKDLNSRNGVKVNGVRIAAGTRKRLDPGDTLAVAKHKYTVQYSPVDLGALGAPPSDDKPEYFLSHSLLERAGLERRPSREEPKRYDVLDDSAGQINDPNRPL